MNQGDGKENGRQGNRRRRLLPPSPLVLPPPLPKDPVDMKMQSPVKPISPSHLLHPMNSSRGSVTSGGVEVEGNRRDIRQTLPSYEQSMATTATANPEGGLGEGTGVERFGRWRGWIEKRALERHGEDGRPVREPATTRPPSYDASVATVLDVPRELYMGQSQEDGQSPVDPPVSLALGQPQLRGTPLPPTDLTKTDCGSRFIAHSSHPITCVLPLPGGPTLLGTTGGLRVLLHEEDDPTRAVWTGLGVWDMTILTLDESDSHRTPRGSVLLHCGGDEKRREARVYKLESLASLAQWAALQYGYIGLELGKKGHTIQFALAMGSRFLDGVPMGYDLALRWAKDYTVLPSGDRAVLAVDTRITSTEITLALATPDSIVVHSGSAAEVGGRFMFAPPKTYYVPFAPRSVSIVELEAAGSAFGVSDTASAVFELDNDEVGDSELGEGVSAQTLGLFVAFAGGRGCVVRTNDLRIVELKRGKGEWTPVNKVKGTYVYTRGNASFLFNAPLALPLGAQVPIAEVLWPELPVSVHASSMTNDSGMGAVRLLGVTAGGGVHVITVCDGERGVETQWASVGAGTFGPNAKLLSTGERQGVYVGYQRGDKDWRVSRLWG